MTRAFSAATVPEAGLSGFSLLGLLAGGPFRRSVSDLKPAQALRLAAFAGLILFFMALLYGVFRPVTAYLWAQPVLGPLLSARVLSLMFGFLFLLMLFSSLLAFLGRLLFSDDAPFFVASPLAPGEYFSFRLAQTALSSLWMLPLFWFPYLWALARAVHAGPFFLVWGALAPFPLAFLSAALGAGLLSLLLGVLSPHRLRSGLFGAAVLAAVAALAALRLARPERLADPDQARTVTAYLAGLNALEPWWWPGTWAGRAVLSALDDPLEAGAWWLFSLAAAVAAWRGVVAAFGPRAFEFWWKGQEFSGVRGRGGKGRAFSSTHRPPAWRVLAQREAVALWRAPGQRLQALLLGSLIALFAFSLGRLPLGRDQDLKDWLYLPVSGVAQLLLVAVAARFVFPLGSLEKPASWMLFHAPIWPKDHLKAKVALFSLLLVPLSLALGLVVGHEFSPSPAARALGLANFLVLPLSLVAMNTGLGLAWTGNKIFAHAEEALTSTGGVVATVFGMLMVVGQNALLILPLHEAWSMGELPRYRPHWVWVALDLFLWGTLHAFAVWVPLGMAVDVIEGKK